MPPDLTDGRRVVRLVSFLGIGAYDVAPYRSTRRPHEVVVTCLNDAVSIYDLAEPDDSGNPTVRVEVVVVGTIDVRKMWFEFVGDEETAPSRNQYVEQLERSVVAPSAVGANGWLGAYIDDQSERRIGEWIRQRQVQWSFIQIPHGTSAEEHWRLFETITEVVRGRAVDLPSLARNGGAPIPLGVPTLSETSGIVVDITNGFRSQPFFASSALAFALQDARLPRARKAEPASVVAGYVVFDPQKNSLVSSPVARTKRPEKTEAQPVEHRDVTQTLEVFEWTSAIVALMRYGRGDELARLLEDFIAVTARRGESPGGAARFRAAVRSFADALCLLRVPALITAHAKELGEATVEFEREVATTLPPLVTQFETLAEWASRLHAEKAISVEGVLAQARLASLAWTLGRYAEAIAVVREGLVSAWTIVRVKRAKVLQPEHPDFTNQRTEREGQLSSASRVLGLLSRLDEKANRTYKIASAFHIAGDVRNDILHGGFRSNAPNPSEMQSRVAEVIAMFQSIADELG